MVETASRLASNDKVLASNWLTKANIPEDLRKPNIPGSNYLKKPYIFTAE
jgi:hypothetical protein